MEKNRESFASRLLGAVVRPVEPVGDFYERLARSTAASAPAGASRPCAGGACA